MNTEVRTTLTRLGAAYALAWATTSMGVGAGSAAIVSMTGNLAHAGLYVALFNISAAAGAALGGRAMDRLGRRRPLIAAYILATAGYLVSGVAVTRSMLALFVVGTAMFAMAFGTANLSRLAAAEMFMPAERGRGVAWIQISATFGAIIGPLLLVLSEPLGALTGRAPMSLVWFLAPPLLIASALITWSAMEPSSLAIKAPPPASGAAPTAAALAGGTILAATVSLAASQAAMAAVMGVSGAAVSHAGHGVPVLGSVMFLHFIGMFGLSRVVGRIVDKVGRLTTILSGLGLLAFGGAIVAVVPGVAGFGIGLLLVGLGWSFGFIGSTVLLTDATAPERRARVLGRADLTGQLSAAALAMASGWWFAARGVAGLGIVAIVVAALPVVLLVPLRAPSRV
jgi:MFS family permease